MYYRRAKKGIRDTTTASLRDFFGADGYAMLKEDATLDDLEALLGFWKRVDAQEGFSERVLRRLFVLNYAPNGMWTDAFKVEVNQRTNVKTNDGKYQTTKENVFTAGDMHMGQSLVVRAIREGRDVAREVDESLMGYTNLLKAVKKL